MTIFAGVACFIAAAILFVQGEDPTIYIDRKLVTKTRGECIEFKADHYYELWPKAEYRWLKNSHELKLNDWITLEDDRKTLKIQNLKPDDGGMYEAKVATESFEKTQIEEVTRFWLVVEDCKPYEKILDFNQCKPACGDACPKGWLHSSGKCYKYFPDAKHWVGAYYHCKSHGAKLATIDNGEQNSFAGKLLHTGDGGWIGLNDQSEENRFIWNFDGNSRPEFTAWGDEEPNNFNGICNAENCVQMQMSNKKWNDVVCDASLSYVCERKDYSGQWTCSGAGKCYKYMKNRLTWVDANKNCTAMGGTLARIDSSSENAFVGGLIDQSVWIGLNDRAEAGVYVWNDYGMGEFSNGATYTNWDAKNPNDRHYFTKTACSGEDCVLINRRKDETHWFDGDCRKELPFICQKDDGPYLSFSAWIAISMGGGLVLSILAGRAYMSFRHQKGRSQVKQMVVDAIGREKKRKNSL